MLFWETLTAKLVSLGFKVNPYDDCVVNKINHGQQCTILWHVGDIKISHADEQVVSDVVTQLENNMGKSTTVVLDYPKVGAIQVTMFDYIKNMLSQLPPIMDGESRTPAPIHFFEVNEEAIKVNEEEAQSFHHYVANLLFLCKRPSLIYKQKSLS